jgi:hypothetical protein
MQDSVHYGRVGIEWYIVSIPYCTLYTILSLLVHNVHCLALYPYFSSLYTIIHYIPTLPFCTLSHIISLLFQSVHYHTLYPYSSIPYTIIHYIPTLPYCTLSYILFIIYINDIADKLISLSRLFADETSFGY